MVIRDDGVFAGSVSGGCIENVVIQRALAGFESIGTKIFFGISTETAWEVGLSCGGEIEIWLESIEENILEMLLASIRSRESCAVQFILDGSQQMQILDSTMFIQQYKTLEQPDGRIIRIYQPSHRILLSVLFISHNF